MAKKSPSYILHAEVTGSGPTVVLLHGFLASSRYWQQVATSLSADHTVIALDLLGFGKSPKPARSKYDYDAQIKAIHATLQQLHVTQPFTLIGHSMGALIALRYSRMFAADINQVILANMPLLFNREQARQNILGENRLYNIALRPGLHDIIWPVFKMVTTLRVLPSHIGEGARARRDYLFQSTGFSRLRSLRNIIYSARIEVDLKTSDVATHIVSGLQDQRARYVDTLNDFGLQANVRITNLAGGHHFPLTHPQLFAELIKN